MVTAASSNVPTYPGPAGIAVARFVPAASSAACPIVGSTATACAAAANASTVNDHETSDSTTAAVTARASPATASPVRRRTSAP
jgi:hypothetical protein